MGRKTYKRYALLIRYEEQEYIDYIERRRKAGDSLADIVKEGTDSLMEKQDRRSTQEK